MSKSLGAHEVRHEFSRQEAAVVRLTYGNGSAFSYEQYELFFNDEEVPRQVGRTDAEGRIVFLPHLDGRWRVRAFSEDGHGADLTLEANYLRLGRDESFGAGEEATGGQMIYCLPGLRLYYKEMSLGLGVKIPGWTDLNEEQDQQGTEGREDYRVIVTLSVMF